MTAAFYVVSFFENSVDFSFWMKSRFRCVLAPLWEAVSVTCLVCLSVRLDLYCLECFKPSPVGYDWSATLLSPSGQSSLSYPIPIFLLVRLLLILLLWRMYITIKICLIALLIPHLLIFSTAKLLISLSPQLLILTALVLNSPYPCPFLQQFHHLSC